LNPFKKLGIIVQKKGKNMQVSVVGAGNLGKSIIKGLEAKYEVEVFSDKTKTHNFDNKIVLIVVKPNSYQHIKFDGTAQAIISLMAGVKLKELKNFFQAQFTIRAMPNLAAKHSLSATSFCGDEEFKSKTQEILNSFGESYYLESEKELDIATALGGSAPAFIALITEALIDGAVEAGLKRDTAKQIATKMLLGSATMLQEMEPSELKNKVMSPGGTTAKGYAALEKYSTRYAFMQAIQESFNHTIKLATSN